jgi:hypothetical protein
MGSRYFRLPASAVSYAVPDRAADFTFCEISTFESLRKNRTTNKTESYARIDQSSHSSLLVILPVALLLFHSGHLAAFRLGWRVLYEN